MTNPLLKHLQEATSLRLVELAGVPRWRRWMSIESKTLGGGPVRFTMDLRAVVERLSSRYETPCGRFAVAVYVTRPWSALAKLHVRYERVLASAPASVTLKTAMPHQEEFGERTKTSITGATVTELATLFRESVENDDSVGSWVEATVWWLTYASAN